MSRHQVRNLLPGIYGIACVIALFLGIIVPVAVVGAMIFGLLWSALSGPREDCDRSERRARRARRRSGAAV